MSSISENNFALQAQNALYAGQQEFKPAKGQSIEKLREVAQNFEAVFIGQMLKPLFQNLGAEKPFGGGESEKMWRSMQVDEYGKAITKAGGIGISDAILTEMLKMQEA